MAEKKPHSLHRSARSGVAFFRASWYKIGMQTSRTGRAGVSESGQSMVEYAIIVGLITMIVAAGMIAFGPSMTEMFSDVDDSSEAQAGVSSQLYRSSGITCQGFAVPSTVAINGTTQLYVKVLDAAGVGVNQAVVTISVSSSGLTGYSYWTGYGTYFAGGGYRVKTNAQGLGGIAFRPNSMGGGSGSVTVSFAVDAGGNMTGSASTSASVTP